MRIFNLVIMKKKDYDFELSDHFVDGYNTNRKLEERFKKVQDKINWSTINPVVHSLKELRKNTWDKNRVDNAIKWLKDNFEVKDDRNSNSSSDKDSE